MAARGLRNNNPGNIDFNPRNKWQGQLGLELDVPSPRFARFDCPENGIRAMAKLILNYRGKDGMPGLGKPGIDTITEIIHRWAPGVENDTAAYIRAVSQDTGFKPDAALTLADPKVLTPVVYSIIHHENGSNPYDAEVVKEGVRRALEG